MRSTRWISVFAALMILPASAGTPADAADIKREFTLANEAWGLKLKLAATPEAQREVWKARPDAAIYGKRMWNQIRSSLAEEWTLEPAAWLLRLAPSAVEVQPNGSTRPALLDATKIIREAIEKHHLRSPKLAPVCVALTVGQDPATLTLLEKIEAQNPDPKIQGVAALAQAMYLKSLGDANDVVRRRLSLIRKAIINSADIEIDGASVAKIAEDELYVIRFLTTGKVAPDLSGTDSGGRPMKLSDYQGKTVILMFWNSGMPEFDRTLEMAAAWEKKFAGKPLVIVGVNNDPTETLRNLQANGRVTWPNFTDNTNLLADEYRIAARPLVFVLDGERKIRFLGTPGSFVELTAEAILSEPAATPAVEAPPAGK
jgi:peroxiredoxin